MHKLLCVHVSPTVCLSVYSYELYRRQIFENRLTLFHSRAHEELTLSNVVRFQSCEEIRMLKFYNIDRLDWIRDFIWACVLILLFQMLAYDKSDSTNNTRPKKKLVWRSCSIKSRYFFAKSCMLIAIEKRDLFGVPQQPKALHCYILQTWIKTKASGIRP